MMNVSKEKRTVFTIGSVVCVEIDNQYKCFFQYVARPAFLLFSDEARAALPPAAPAPRRLRRDTQRGMYIRDGRKYVVK